MHELGLRRLRDELGLVPVEYPTTRVMDADPRDRARDVTAAFADPSIAAVMATIGGDDQLTDPAAPGRRRAPGQPKPYFGYSDNTTLLNHLFGLGIVGFHGGSVMVHLGRPARAAPDVDRRRCGRRSSSRAGTTWRRPAEYADEPPDWDEPGVAGAPPPHVAGRRVDLARARAAVVEGPPGAATSRCCPGC